MDNNEAKRLLSAYRPNGADAHDPAFREALRHAELDPVLAKAFAEQRAFDARISRALRSVPVPSEGTDYAHLGMRLAPSPRRYGWWSAAALAACLALVFTVVTLKNGSGALELPKDANLPALAAYLSDHERSLGLMNSDYGQLTNWLQQRGGPIPAEVPAALLRLATLGCQTWETSRGKVSLVCFMGADQKPIHLYVFENPDAFGELPPLAQPKFDQSGSWAPASWQDGQRAYVLGMSDEGDTPAKFARLFS